MILVKKMCHNIKNILININLLIYLLYIIYYIFIIILDKFLVFTERLCNKNIYY